MEFSVRFAKQTDQTSIAALYRRVAAEPGGIAREPDEITAEYINNNITKSLENGVCLVIENPDDANSLIAEIHCYKLTPRLFSHVLSELTIVVHPDFQNQKLGKLLFISLLDHVEKDRPDIRRVELIARESNKRAIAFYEKIGFRIEGRFESRVDCGNGEFEADIPMAWLRV